MIDRNAPLYIGTSKGTWAAISNHSKRVRSPVVVTDSMRVAEQDAKAYGSDGIVVKLDAAQLIDTHGHPREINDDNRHRHGEHSYSCLPIGLALLAVGTYDLIMDIVEDLFGDFLY